MLDICSINKVPRKC